MTPDPITPGSVTPIVGWCKVAAGFIGGLTVILGSVVGAVNYLVDERLEDFGDEMEEHAVELAQTVVDDDIDWQNKKMDLLEKRIERLEDSQ